MFCRYCGTKNPGDSLFCKKCGKNVKEESPQSTPTAKKSVPDQKSPHKTKSRKKLPAILGITLPLGIIIILAALIFTGIIPLLNQNEPVADAGEDIRVEVGEKVVLSASGSYDPDGNKLEYIWEVDGREYHGETVELNIPKRGTFTAKLIVKDSRYSNTDSAVIRVTGKEDTEEPTQEITEVVEEIPSQCDISFSEGNTFEMSTEGQEEGYPYFTFLYPDGWEVMELPTETRYGYIVQFSSPIKIEVETENSGNLFYPLLSEAIFILNDEYKSREPQSIVDELWESFLNEPNIEIIDYSKIGKDIFFIEWHDNLGNEWVSHFKFNYIDNDVVIYDVSGISYCFKDWGEYLFNSAVADRLNFEGTEVVTDSGERSDTTQTQATLPTVGLTIIEGPVSSDGICYYRVKANTTGSPSPSITFDRDDSNGAWGSDITQINLSNPNDSITLTGTASNSAGSASDSITLTWGCEVPRDEPKDEPKDEGAGEEEECPKITGWKVDGTSISKGGSIDVFPEKLYTIEPILNHYNFSSDLDGSLNVWEVTGGEMYYEYNDYLNWMSPTLSGSFNITYTVKDLNSEDDVICTRSATLKVNVIEIYY